MWVAPFLSDTLNSCNRYSGQSCHLATLVPRHFTLVGADKIRIPLYVHTYCWCILLLNPVTTSLAICHWKHCWRRAFENLQWKLRPQTRSANRNHIVCTPNLDRVCSLVVPFRQGLISPVPMSNRSGNVNNGSDNANNWPRVSRR